MAEQPSSGSDPNVSYKLESFYDTMWKRRYDICDGDCTYDKTMPYAGTVIGETFDGDTWGEDKARPPWAWDDPDDGPVYMGDWFFKPAQTLVTHLSVPGEVSFDYVHNPISMNLARGCTVMRSHDPVDGCFGPGPGLRHRVVRSGQGQRYPVRGPQRVRRR